MYQYLFFTSNDTLSFHHNIIVITHSICLKILTNFIPIIIMIHVILLHFFSFLLCYNKKLIFSVQISSSHYSLFQILLDSSMPLMFFVLMFNALIILISNDPIAQSFLSSLFYIFMIFIDNRILISTLPHISSSSLE